jgi:hypothetical protein
MMVQMKILIAVSKLIDFLLCFNRMKPYFKNIFANKLKAYPVCASNQFTCTNKRCITNTYVCDGKYNY